ncbi:MAG: LemA family protein [Candidatus Gracilibacteria bacterium]
MAKTIAQKSLLSRIPTWGYVLGVLVLLALWTVGKYNGLIGLEGAVNNGWAQVETEYQRRADLVPQLVSTVEGVADFEQSTLLAVTEARTNWLNVDADPSATVDDQIVASQTFDSAFSKLLVSVEAYPTITATESFITLQAQLEGTENRISVSRMDYNTAVTAYNVAIKRIPTNFIASIFGFESHTLFESAEGSELAPDVNFDY